MCRKSYWECFVPFKNPEERKRYATAYAKQWRARNPDKVQRANKAYRAANATELSKVRRERYAADKEVARAAARRYQAMHPERVKTRAAKRKAEDPQTYRDVQRRASLKKLYGLTESAYDDLLRAQAGVCAICRTVCGTGRRLAVDHCHVTGRVRGLLCSNCNQALGKMRDDVELLQRAVHYLLGTAS